MSKLIIVDTCLECPYAVRKYSEPHGFVYEGTSCKHPHAKKYMSVSSACLGNRKLHKDCPLDDYEACTDDFDYMI